MKYFILLISGSSVKGGENAEFDAEGARTIGADIQKVLPTISMRGILCFFVNGVNC
jgi:hypothetical protein